MTHIHPIVIPCHQNKNPLSQVQTFQDIPLDHANKTVTYETFPHSSLPLASVHPCKHASVMKKVIEKMGAKAGEEQRRALGGKADAAPAKVESKDKERKRWLGGAIRKVTGGEKDNVEKAGEGEEEDGGLQVDYYLVIVRPRLFFLLKPGSS